MKKRIVGALVLVIIGVLLPLLLVRWLQTGSDAPDQNTRVYEITPDGQAKRAGADTNKAAEAKKDAEARQDKGQAETDANTGVPDNATAGIGKFAKPPPAAVSPENRAAGGSTEQTAPVADNGGDNPPAAAPNNARQPAGGGDQSLRRDVGRGDGWVVQVGSFSEEHGAERLAGRLDHDYDAFYSAGQVKGKTYYRVAVGPFDNKSAARDAAQKLRDQGQSTLVRRAH